VTTPSAADPTGRTVIVVPTYDEVANLRPLLAAVDAAAPDLDVLVVDDASPDGTGQLADRIAATDPRVHVLHRPAKQGLGAAYVAGFQWALARGYAVVGEMDADGSHQPAQLPALRAALAEADLVIGSRWVAGGSTVNWSRRREWLSRAGNAYTRALLGVPIRDVTAGFRLYRRSALETIRLEDVASAGYVFQADLAFRAIRGGLRVVEVPIEFVERERGQSKMTPAVAVESLRRITQWGLAERARRWRVRDDARKQRRPASR
jgi:dolichol-phosphate mannosyltransferase